MLDGCSRKTSLIPRSKELLNVKTYKQYKEHNSFIKIMIDLQTMGYKRLHLKIKKTIKYYHILYNIYIYMLQGFADMYPAFPELPNFCKSLRHIHI